MVREPERIKRIYFVGIKGVGMASLAEISKEAGFEVTGSDISEEFLTDTILLKHNIKIDIGFETSKLKEFVDGKPEEALVITTAAHEGLQNSQCIYAKAQGIQVLTHGQAVGYFMAGELFKRDFKGISVLGCHGKTTVTGMVATALFKAGLNPSYTIGTSEIFPLGDAGHLGKGEYFVAEADEFISDVNKDKTIKFLYQNPEYAIINNIDYDHPDVYKNLDEVKNTFEKFCLENIKENGTLIINGDDPNTKFIIHNSKFKDQRGDIKTITYGEESSNDYQIFKFKEKGWGSEFEVISYGKNLGIFKLSVPGYHNAKNSLSVVALMNEIGIELNLIKKSLAYFQGTKRRQEKVGETLNGAIVIDDYAHHPDEIIKTIEAVKRAFSDKKVVCLFQPHTLGRTQSLREEFAGAFTGVEEVIFLPIFTSKRENEVNYEQLYDSIKKTIQSSGLEVYFPEDTRSKGEMSESPYFYKKNREAVVKYILNKYNSNEFVVLTLGAGDLYRITYDLVEKY